jgi:hypothetical protein
MRMPHLSVWFLRAALVHFVLTAAMGIYLSAAKGGFLSFEGPDLVPLHLHLALVGWTLQLAFGVAFWILPRLKKPGAQGGGRGSYHRGRELPAWLAFVGINLSSVIATVGLTAISAALVLGSAICFVVHAAPRALVPSGNER